MVGELTLKFIEPQLTFHTEDPTPLQLLIAAWGLIDCQCLNSSWKREKGASCPPKERENSTEFADWSGRNVITKQKLVATTDKLNKSIKREVHSSAIQAKPRCWVVANHSRHWSKLHEWWQLSLLFQWLICSRI